jgi:hypothetical protein
MVKVHYGEGIANHTGPESCAAYREVCGEALTGERAGQPIEPRNISHPGGRRSYVCGRQNERVRNASARTVLRGRRPWHVRKLFVWEPGDLQVDHLHSRGGPCREGEEP